jgi:hypothetical protein
MFHHKQVGELDVFDDFFQCLGLTHRGHQRRVGERDRLWGCNVAISNGLTYRIYTAVEEISQGK